MGSGWAVQGWIGQGRAWFGLISARRAPALPAGFYGTQFGCGKPRCGWFGPGKLRSGRVGYDEARADDLSAEGLVPPH